MSTKNSQSRNDGLLDRVCAILEKHDIKGTPKAKKGDKAGKKEEDRTLLERADAVIEEMSKLRMPVMSIGVLEFMLSKSAYGVLRFCSKVGHLATDEKPEEAPETEDVPSGLAKSTAGGESSGAPAGSAEATGGPQPAAATAAA